MSSRKKKDQMISLDDPLPKIIHEEISPARLAWACQNRLRRSRQRQIVEDLGLPVPDCLLPLSGNLSKDTKRRIKRAIDDALAYGEAVYTRESKRIQSRESRHIKAVRDAIRNTEAREQVTKGVEQGEKASPEDVGSLDGKRAGDPEPPPGQHAIDYEILTSFVEFSQDFSPTCWALVGPAGGGKSVAIIMKMLSHCTMHDKARYVIVRSTYRQLHDTTIPTFFQWVPRELGKWDASNEVFTLAGKWEFFFRSCERPEDVDKFKGIEITGYFINEAMEVKQDVKNLLDQRCGRYPLEEYVDELGVKRKRGTSKIFRALDSNPPDMEHWLYKAFVEKPLDGHRFVLQPPYENVHNLPPGYYDKMREAYRDSPDLIDRYIEGKWGAVYRGKSVYKEFDSRVHVAKEPLKYMPGLRVFAGLDFGLTPACIWTQLRPNGTWALIAEMCADNTSADEFGDAVIAYTREFFPGSEVQWYGDPSGFKRSETDMKSVYDILAPKGIYIIPGAVTIAARLEAVKRRLRMRGGILVSPSCVRAVTGFSGAYCYKEVGSTGYFHDKPEKNKWSHIHDAIQYVASMIFVAPSAFTQDRWLEMNHKRPVNPKVGY